jgi:hypothetical protein
MDYLTGSSLNISLETSRVASACRCVFRTGLVLETAFFAVLLGLAIRFSKSDFISATTCFFVAAASYLSTFFPVSFATIFADRFSSFCFALAPFRGEGGSFYIRLLKVVKVSFSSASCTCVTRWRVTLLGEADLSASAR